MAHSMHADKYVALKRLNRKKPKVKRRRVRKSEIDGTKAIKEYAYKIGKRTRKVKARG